MQQINIYGQGERPDNFTHVICSDENHRAGIECRFAGGKFYKLEDGDELEEFCGFWSYKEVGQ